MHSVNMHNPRARLHYQEISPTADKQQAGGLLLPHVTTACTERGEKPCSATPFVPNFTSSETRLGSVSQHPSYPDSFERMAIKSANCISHKSNQPAHGTKLSFQLEQEKLRLSFSWESQGF